MTRDYVLDHGFAEERERLSGMESLWDPGSRHCSRTSASARVENTRIQWNVRLLTPMMIAGIGRRA